METKVPGNERSREGKYNLWNFRSWERKFFGTKVPVTVHTAVQTHLVHQSVTLGP